ncbi:MAG: lysylphosphatidylglycerol synthase transmembrane domain-containing protein [Chloroflexi bacterium]|nr:lysylphosphatidylglycerol synthase transmembrane domain-containing protein [Chloroflexota bacterium]MDA1218995.1 lysylphosphatidylglycerol synthase transmembrane domain-containing protein [Chloroflexota bacterium]PKB57400.1 MAG: hypothetical protein BZY73_03375 [SAR202 cluster bacterium Casp-Chloro-G3]
MFRSFQRQGDPVSVAQRIFSIPTLVSIALAIALLVFLALRFDIDLTDTWQQIRSGNPWLLTLAVIVHYTTFIFRGARWRLLLQNAQGPNRCPPGVLYCSELTLLGWFANSVAWFRLGDAYRAHLYQQEQHESFSRTVGTIVSERALDTVLVVALLLVSVPFLVSRGSTSSWTVLGIALLLLTILAVALFIIGKSGDRLKRRLPGWLAERFQHFQEGVIGSFGQIPLVTLLGLMGWLAEVARLYLVTLALGIPLSLALIVFITLANSLLTLVPTPGGVGAVESGVAGLLVRMSSVAASGAAALVLVDRTISYVSIILTGGIIFLTRHAYRRRVARNDGLDENA